MAKKETDKVTEPAKALVEEKRKGPATAAEDWPRKRTAYLAVTYKVSHEQAQVMFENDEKHFKAKGERLYA